MMLSSDAFYYQCSSSYSVFLLREGREEGKGENEWRKAGGEERKKAKKKERKERKAKYFDHGNIHFCLSLLKGWVLGEHCPEATRSSNCSKDILEDAK